MFINLQVFWHTLREIDNDCSKNNIVQPDVGTKKPLLPLSENITDITIPGITLLTY